MSIVIVESVHLYRIPKVFFYALLHQAVIHLEEAFLHSLTACSNANQGRNNE